jgi:hypothetical protein
MGVEYDHFVGVTEETDLFVRHFYSAVVHSGHMLYGFLQFLRTEFNLGIGHLDWHQLICLAEQLFLVSFEVLKAITDVRTLYLLAPEILNFVCCSLHVFFTKVDKGKMLFKVFLFTVDSCFLDFECF